jgi:hypothetical protein
MGIRIGKRKFDNRKTLAMFITGGLLWFGLIILIGYFHINEGQRIKTLQSGSVSVDKKGKVDPSDFSGIAIYAKVSEIDVDKGTITFRFIQFPRGSVMDTTNPLSRNIPLIPITINYGMTSVNFVQGKEMAPQDIVMTIGTGMMHALKL